MSEMMQRQAAMTAARISSENHADGRGDGGGASESAGTAAGGDGSMSSMMPISQASIDRFNIGNQDLAIGMGGDISSLITSREGVFETNIFETLDGSFLAPAGLNQSGVMPEANFAGDMSVAGATSEMTSISKETTGGVGIPGGGQRGR